MGVTVLYGGAFDPPHLGHVALADAARERFGVELLVVLVSERPVHRSVHASADDRLALARAAFPRDDVRLDPYPRTVELLRAARESYKGKVVVLGLFHICDPCMMQGSTLQKVHESVRSGVGPTRRSSSSSWSR